MNDVGRYFLKNVGKMEIEHFAILRLQLYKIDILPFVATQFICLVFAPVFINNNDDDGGDDDRAEANTL